MSKKYDIYNFNDNGIAWPLELDNKSNLNELENEYFKFKKKSQEIFNNSIILKPHLLSKFFFELSIDKNVLENVKKIIGEDVYIWSSAFFAKAPGEGKIVSFHQDNPYWQLTTTKVVTAWIALTDSNVNSGALQIVPGSHKIGLIKKLDVKNARQSYLKGEKTTDQKDLLSFNQNLDDYINKNPPVTVDLKPGEFSIHHVNTVHGSGVNETKNFRIGFAVRYVSSDTQHLEENSDLATHISGKKNSYYKDEQIVDKDFSIQAIDQYKFSMKSTGVFGNKKY